MGHQFPRAAAAAAVALALTACGGSDGDGEPPPVLDVAREQVAAAPDSSDSASADEPTADDAGDAAPAELPLPDPSSFRGSYRVVNLVAEPTGDGVAHSSVDVWARRTFTNGPVLLAEDVGFGAASPYFEAPVGSKVVIVSAGAGPDGEERAVLPDPADGEQVTTVFANGDDRTLETAINLYERGNDRAPVPPDEGDGLVVVVGVSLSAYDEELSTSVGGDAFVVGDGSETCRLQRVEATGAAAEILGEADRIELEVAPGAALISLHPWPTPNGCDQPSALEVAVDVAAGSTTLLLVYTADGTSLETLTLPLGG